VPLTPQEAAAIETRIARVEARTGVDVVTAVVGRSDAYPEIAWKAFALGATLAAFAVVALDLWRPDWMTAHALWFAVVPILAIGTVSALLALTVPEYARRFVDRERRDGEVRQYAQALFLERRLSATRFRDGVLILASVFERRIEIVADVGFDGHVPAEDWATVIDAMTPHLAAARPAVALLHALERIEVLLTAKGYAPRPGAGNELSNAPIDVSGAQ